MKKSLGMRGISILVAMLLMVSLFAACGVKAGQSAGGAGEGTSASTAVGTEAAKAEESKLQPYEIKWYVNGSVQTDPQPVYDEMNKLLKDKLNATLNVVTFDWGQYNDKMKIILASNEPFDLCFTSSWANDYLGAVSKGAYLPLDDLLEKAGKNIKSAIPAKYWPAVTIGGKIYGIPNYQIFASAKGISAQKELVEKYRFDYKSVKKPADLEPFLEAVKQSEPGITPFLPDINTPLPFTGIDAGFTYDVISGVLGMNAKTADYKVMNVYESPEAMEYFKLIRSWYQKGYIRKDAASLKDFRADQKSGKYACFVAGNLKPGNEVDTEAFTGYPVIDIPTAEPYVNTAGIIATLTAVSKTSKDPERAMMFYDLMFSDKQLYNLMCFGIEGKHYNKVSEDTVEAIADSGYNPSTDWEFGNQFNAFYRKGQKAGIWEETIKLNENAKPSPVLGFTYNKEILKTENAQVDAIFSEYLPGLVTGTLDPEKAIADMVGKMKKAGLDKIAEDMQKQVDEWKAANVK